MTVPERQSLGTPVSDRPTVTERPLVDGQAHSDSMLAMSHDSEFVPPSFDPGLMEGGSSGESRPTQTFGLPPQTTVPIGPVTPSPFPKADFGPYELLEEVGRGGMGVVYRAHQRQLDRIVAVKMILASHLANVEQVQRFYAEARAAARLQDPRIVAIHDVGQIHGQHFFAMEFMPGPSLAQMVRSGPIDWRTAARYVMEVARAVGRLHRRGVVHRDLKPSNILLDALGQPCVTDFGLAKMLSPDGPATRTGAIVGTPSYMAPEQAAGRGDSVSPLSDVYSMGAILYELVTGSPPFEAANPLDTLVQVLESEPTLPSRLNPGLPRTLETICLKCLEKSPQSRYASADDLAADLERLLQGEQIEARQLSLSQRLRRWARREPALVARVTTLGACALFTQIDQAAFRRLDSSLNSRLMLVITLGILASIMFQTLLKTERWTTIARYAWSIADMILFGSVLMFTGGLQTPLIAGYVLLITTSGLWFREGTVWFTTLLSVISYGAVYATDVISARDAPRPSDALIFLLGLVLTGFVVSYQVKRVRALSAFYEKRQLP